MVALSNCMLVGDQKKYLAMLLTLKVEVDHGTGEPSDVLAQDSLFVGKTIGSSAKTATEVRKHNRTLHDLTIFVIIDVTFSFK